MGIEGVLLEIPSALKIRKPGYPRPRVSFSYLPLYNTCVRKHGLCCARAFRDRPAPPVLEVGSKTTQNKKMPESRFLIKVRSGTKEIEKMPESRFLI